MTPRRLAHDRNARCLKDLVHASLKPQLIVLGVHDGEPVGVLPRDVDLEGAFNLLLARPVLQEVDDAEVVDCWTSDTAGIECGVIAATRGRRSPSALSMGKRRERGGTR